MTTKFKLAAIALACTTAFNASAAVELYNNDEGMTFTADGLINVFYSNSSIEKTDATGAKTDRDQSRVRTGFLPSYIGLNSSNKVGDYTVATRSSFWVTLSDTDGNRGAEGLGTRTGVDIRQFYATVSGDFGEVLLGKDFGLFNRSNILGDELLLGFGQTSDFWGLTDGGNVSFGNIATGYTYPFPKAQITYRTPDLSGFKIAVAVMDPNKAAADSSEDSPRLEAEVTYNSTFDDGSLKAWVSGMSQSSELADGTEYDQSGVGYGVNVKLGGVSLTASGYTAEGAGHVAGLDQFVGDDNIENEGYLVQASYTMGDNRFVVTYGESETKNAGSVDDGSGGLIITGDAVHSNAGVAYFRTIVPGVTAVFEYNNTEVEATGSLIAEDNDTFSIGAVVTF